MNVPGRIGPHVVTSLHRVPVSAHSYTQLDYCLSSARQFQNGGCATLVRFAFNVAHAHGVLLKAQVISGSNAALVVAKSAMTHKMLSWLWQLRVADNLYLLRAVMGTID